MRSKMAQLLKLCSVFRDRHAPLLQLHELYNLAVSLVRRKIFCQKLSLETSP
ncbi:hypothetical protein A2U01_0108308, partial [Trifolium medium]|nr:hypothetical protein [Trifolium medium]